VPTKQLRRSQMRPNHKRTEHHSRNLPYPPKLYSRRDTTSGACVETKIESKHASRMLPRPVKKKKLRWPDFRRQKPAAECQLGDLFLPGR